ncbi:hypothetical protein INT45_006028 [Circinella minor]|uniref:Cora-domain-containing protein n=1 Tax=Circinella minor TaxID=1195481 RepID=A0A8H7RUP0_9FUNG|nr:hypothetical protein INT45_006028 [Circinella minor]
MMACLNESVSEESLPRQLPEMQYIHPTDNTTKAINQNNNRSRTTTTTYPLSCPIDNNIKQSKQQSISCSPSSSKPNKRHSHQRQTLSIDLNTCKRKQSLYGDASQTQIIPFQQHTEQTVCYYHSETGRIESNSLLNLHHPHFSLQELLTMENYWIDIKAPTISEMKIISKIFRIHPLTTEDILSQETREKCDVFRNYLFVCYRAFVHESHVLKPVGFYNIIHKQSILTFHFSHIPQLQHVYNRVEQMEDYIVVAPDWLNYAILDVITDQFAPLIHQIEADVDAIDDPAMLLEVNDDETELVLRIGSCRKRVMQMLRLLGTKADVVRALIKRLDDTAVMNAAAVASVINNQNNQNNSKNGSISSTTTTIATHTDSTIASAATLTPDIIPSVNTTNRYHFHHPRYHKRMESASSLGYIRSPPCRRYTLDDEEQEGDKIFPDVALYLGDVQDHLITMLQNLSHYETVLARAHSNYLAQISIKLSQTSNSTNHVIGRLTVFATILMPMNLVTGLWGMNVKVPGKDYDDLLYFFWIVSSLAVFAIGAFTLARRFQCF